MLKISVLVLGLAVLNNIVSEGPEGYTQCVTYIVNKYFIKSSGSVGYIISSTSNENVTENRQDFTSAFFRSFREYAIPLTILTNLTVTPFHEMKYSIPSGYIVMAETYDSMAYLLNNINETDKSWFPHSKFLFVVPKLNCDENSIMNLISILKPHFVFQFLILTDNCVNNNTIDIYSWFPYENNKCAETVDVKKVAQWKHNRLVDNTDLFPPKIPKKFNGCKISFPLIDWPPMMRIRNYNQTGDCKVYPCGLQVKYVQLIAEKLNLSLKYDMSIPPEERWGKQLPNGSWDGIIGALLSGKVDIMFQAYSPDRVLRVQSGGFFHFLRMTMYLPKPRKLSLWYSILRIFSAELWLTILLTYVVCSLILWALSRTVEKENTALKYITSCLFILCRGFLGTPSDAVPISSSVRLFFVSWLIYTLHLNSMYTSSLLSSITTPFYEKPLDDVFEVFNSDIKTYISPVPDGSQILRGVDVPKHILPRFRAYGDDHRKDIEAMVHSRDIAILDTDLHMKTVAKELITHMYEVKNIETKYWYCLIMRKGHPYFQSMNKLSYRFQGTGLYYKWENDESMYDIVRARAQEHIKPLMLVELQVIFYIWLLSLSLATIVFIGELMIAKILKGQQTAEREMHRNSTVERYRKLSERWLAIKSRKDK